MCEVCDGNSKFSLSENLKNYFFKKLNFKLSLKKTLILKFPLIFFQKYFILNF